MAIAIRPARPFLPSGRNLVKNATRYPTREDRDRVIELGMEAGIDQTLDHLEAYLLEAAG